MNLLVPPGGFVSSNKHSMMPYHMSGTGDEQGTTAGNMLGPGEGMKHDGDDIGERDDIRVKDLSPSENRVRMVCAIEYIFVIILSDNNTLYLYHFITG